MAQRVKGLDECRRSVEGVLTMVRYSGGRVAATGACRQNDPCCNKGCTFQRKEYPLTGGGSINASDVYCIILSYFSLRYLAHGIAISAASAYKICQKSAVGHGKGFLKPGRSLRKRTDATCSVYSTPLKPWPARVRGVPARWQSFGGFVEDIRLDEH